MDENKIVIVEDDGNRIAYDDVTIKHDTVDRNEVAEIEIEINNLVNQKLVIDERIDALNKKLSYAKKVIAIADAERAEKNVSAENQEPVEYREV